ncbi:MAG: dihydropteroate synthase [Acidimicrobiales bacterium]
MVMGVLNVTPDSFSDGGRWLDPDAAIAHGLEMVAEGAEVVDVGGESTRPGAAPVAAAEERRRVVPVVRALSPHVRVSVDTRKPAVAEAAVEAGATILNDVSASLYRVAAAAGAGWVAMHMQGDPTNMQVAPRYGDVGREVRDFLTSRALAAREEGVEEIWIDPGIGFGKTPAHNLRLLGGLRGLVATGFPVAIGVSRKSFLSRISDAAGPEDRLEGSLAAAAWALREGAAMVRVHDVAPTVAAVRLLGAAVSA